MTVFADTSGLFALVDADDTNHRRAHAAWERMALEAVVVTTQLVAAETTALVQHRLGLRAATDVHRLVLANVDVLSLTTTQFARAVERWAARSRRRLSLVDVTSFLVMEDLGIATAFAVDPDFSRAGYDLLP